jgi:DNA-binding SARP family transcriptional activator
MKVRILGPFQLEDGGRQVTIGGVRQRAVLARLSLQANEVVPSEQLLVDLWGEDSPPGPANALQAAISRLRRVLPPGRLITKAAVPVPETSSAQVRAAVCGSRRRWMSWFLPEVLPAAA